MLKRMPLIIVYSSAPELVNLKVFVLEHTLLKAFICILSKAKVIYLLLIMVNSHTKHPL